MSHDWSPQQRDALQRAADWHKGGNEQVFRLFGFAGTGKTTIARYLAEQIEDKAVFAAYTGKASIVMQKSGCDGASTIHSLIYAPKQDQNTGEVLFSLDDKSPLVDSGLAIIDECSMVGDEIGKDLLSFNKPVLVLGDPAQLPPVKNRNGDRTKASGGFFTDHDPDVMLTEIHRQAEGNPIIQLATTVREGGKLELGRYGDSMVVDMAYIRANPNVVTDADQVLVGKNLTRHNYNRRLRALADLDGADVSAYPVTGDRLVCLKNDRPTNIFNGGLFTVTRAAKPVDAYSIAMSVQSIDFPDRAAFEVVCRRECFEGVLEDVHWKERMGFQEFAYGYALTVHKAQGSQWAETVLFDESYVFRQDRASHLYTGITRAAERVTIVQ